VCVYPLPPPALRRAGQLVGAFEHPSPSAEAHVLFSKLCGLRFLAGLSFEDGLEHQLLPSVSAVCRCLAELGASPVYVGPALAFFTNLTVDSDVIGAYIEAVLPLLLSIMEHHKDNKEVAWRALCVTALLAAVLALAGVSCEVLALRVRHPGISPVRTKRHAVALCG
jgi:hypothetical protein